MSRKKKGINRSSTVATIALILVVIAAVIPSQWWTSIVTFAAIFGVMWLIMNSSRRRSMLKITPIDPSGKSVPVTEKTSNLERSLNLTSATGGESDFHTFRVSATEPQFTIPKPKALSSDARWIREDELITVGGHHLKGGMFYFSEKSDRASAQEPSLIDGQLPIQKTHVDITEKLTGYWPSYSTISPAARQAYLQWLSGGRRAPEVDIGYVFIFFYGLERRAVVDAANDDAARADLPEIMTEVKRLRSLYGGNSSFRSYASNLLNHLHALDVEPQMYLKGPPRVEPNALELPMALRVALGQMAADKHPLNPDWALAWSLAEPNIRRRTAVSRCAEQFAQLFKAAYSKRGGVRNFVFGHNMSKGCMYANQKETRTTKATENPGRAA